MNPTRGNRVYAIYQNAKFRCKAAGLPFRFASFDEFSAAIGPRPTPQHSAKRDASGEYHWITQHERARKRRDTPHTSQYRGVCWDSNEEKWRAYYQTVPSCGKPATQVRIGYFTDETDAGNAVVAKLAELGIQQRITEDN